MTTRNGSDQLPATLLDILADTGGPHGIDEFGYTAGDVPRCTERAMKQQRLLACCPPSVDEADIRRVLHGSIKP